MANLMNGIKLTVVTPPVDYNENYSNEIYTHSEYPVNNAVVTLYKVSPDNGFSEEFCSEVYDSTLLTANDALEKAANVATGEVGGVRDKGLGKLSADDFVVSDARTYYTYTYKADEDTFLTSFEESKSTNSSGEVDKSCLYAVFVSSNGNKDGMYMGLVWLERIKNENKSEGGE